MAGKKHKRKQTADDEEIGFDFSKLNIFSRKGKGKSQEGYKRFAWVAFLLIPIILSVFLRVQPALLPATDDWARNSIYNTIKGNIKGQLDAQYPNLPDANKQSIIDEEFQKVKESGTVNFNGQSVDIEQVVQQNSAYFKEQFQNPSGHTYLLAIDPYYYYRLTRNVVEKGHQFDYQGEDGLYYSTKELAGRPIEDRSGSKDRITSLHVYVQYYFYKLVSLFNPDANLMAVVFYIPVLIGALAVIPAFFIARKAGGDIAGFFASIFVALHPAFLTRTAGGFADTGAYNVLFP